MADPLQIFIKDLKGDKAFTYPFSKRVIAQATGDKELFTISGATHFDLYDNYFYVDKAVAKLTGFFRKKLEEGRGCCKTLNVFH